MKRILALTDFSDSAMNACLYAAEIARKSGALIYLLHVIEPVIEKIKQPFPLHVRLQEEIIKDRIRDLHAVRKAMLRYSPSIKIESELARGTATTAILDCAIKKEVDLILMGIKGTTGLKEFFLGQCGHRYHSSGKSTDTCHSSGL